MNEEILFAKTTSTCLVFFPSTNWRLSVCTRIVKAKFILQKMIQDLEQFFERQLFHSIIKHFGGDGRVDFVEWVHHNLFGGTGD